MQTVVWSTEIGFAVRSGKKNNSLVNGVIAKQSNLLQSEIKAIKKAIGTKSKEVKQWWD
ncbi:hypothetical protein [Paenibacillus sp. GYB003]|uniref:hypothetical protein n=1 Tax=Paenibacillus sp. GYB003 TaxID=2994392 RepID=UPI002F967C46